MSLNPTNIEWVKSPDGSQGYSFNPITGCLNNCPYCYARKLANTRLKERYRANKNLGYDGGAPRWMIESDPFYPRFWKDRIYDKDLFRMKPRGIFTCDMSDLFGIGVPDDWTKAVLSQCSKFWQHRFYLLTKQPQNLIKFDFPDNAWVGVSATDERSYAQSAMHLIAVRASVKYISFEPLLDKVDGMLLRNTLPAFDWVIIGQQTPVKKATMPKIEDIREIVEACDKAGVKVFLKNNLAGLLTHHDRWAFSRDEDIPQMLKLRQEMPG